MLYERKKGKGIFEGHSQRHILENIKRFENNQ